MGHALTVKGQVTIPKAMREHMGVAQGQEIEFVAQPGGQVLMFPAEACRAQRESFPEVDGYRHLRHDDRGNPA